MPGARNRRFRAGDNAELLAEFILSTLAFTYGVPRQEDVGHDFVCSLSEREGDLVKAGPTFTVQAKKGRGPVIYDKQHEIKWIENQENPMFICAVNAEQLEIELYSTWNMLNGFLLKSAPEVQLVPGTPEDGYGEVTWPEEGLMVVPLGKPAIRVSASDVMDAKKVRSLGSALRDWIEMDRQNIVNRSAGMYWVQGPTDYETNAGLPPGTRLRLGFYWNPNNFDKCLFNFGQIASALRIVAWDRTEKGIPTKYTAEQVRSLEAALKAHEGLLSPLAIDLLRNRVRMDI